MTLSEDLLETERHGFPRSAEPFEYQGHELWILNNDAHWTNDERLLFHFTLYCPNCDEESTMRGRTRIDDEYPEYHVTLMKVATFKSFLAQCQS